MLDEFERPGKLEGAGFYEYADGKRTRLWPGLREAFPPVADPSSIVAQGPRRSGCCSSRPSRRVKCLDEGVIESVADANIGSIMGIGFPGWTGGVLQYINGYEGGLPGFVARARELAETLRRALHAARVARRPRRARRDATATKRRSPPPSPSRSPGGLSPPGDPKRSRSARRRTAGAIAERRGRIPTAARQHGRSPIPCQRGPAASSGYTSSPRRLEQRVGELRVALRIVTRVCEVVFTPVRIG